MSFGFNLRLATEEDIPALHTLIEASVRGLQAEDYAPAQIEGALGPVLGLDTQLIRDGTYFVAEAKGWEEDLTSGAKAHNDPAASAARLTSGPVTKHGAAAASPAALETLTGPLLAGCGGWSKRKTLFGADRGPGRAHLTDEGPSLGIPAWRDDGMLNPATDAAKVRAIFVHPKFARRGLGSQILARVEAEAAAAGFRRFEMGSTLTGVPLYLLRGYVEVERIAVPLANGEVLPVVKMTKLLG
jgi:GNAT superfamily N-acetyltransferase